MKQTEWEKKKEKKKNGERKNCASDPKHFKLDLS